jgi:hypothetical protein
MARLLRKLSCTNRGQQNMGESRRIPKMKTPTLKQKLDDLANYAADELLEAYKDGDMTAVFHSSERAKGTGAFISNVSNYMDITGVD